MTASQSRYQGMNRVVSEAGPESAVARNDAPRLTAEEVLLGAAELILQPGAWAQGSFARDKNDISVGVKDPNAVCFCAAGAIYRVAGTTKGRANDIIDMASAVAHRRGAMNIADYNDRWGMTAAEVAKVLRVAAGWRDGEPEGSSTKDSPAPLIPNQRNT